LAVLNLEVLAIEAADAGMPRLRRADKEQLRRGTPRYGTDAAAHR
jgi:hypothetical protein